MPKSCDPHPASGSFQNSRSWADKLSSYKISPSQQKEPSFKVTKPDLAQSSTSKSAKEESVFSGENRFKVYSAINKSDSASEESNDSIVERGEKEERSLDAKDMLKHLRKIQEELKTGEQTRQILEKDLADRHTRSPEEQMEKYDSGKCSNIKMKEKLTSHPDQELSQYSFGSEKSSRSVSRESQPSPVCELPLLSGTSSVQRELPVRKSPNGDLLRAGSPASFGDSKQEITSTEYSFAMAGGKQRSTSTPGKGLLILYFQI